MAGTEIKVIKVKWFGDRDYMIEISPDDTIRELKVKLYHRFGVLPAEQPIVKLGKSTSGDRRAKSKVLPDETLLRNCLVAGVRLKGELPPRNTYQKDESGLSSDVEVEVEEDEAVVNCKLEMRMKECEVERIIPFQKEKKVIIFGDHILYGNQSIDDPHQVAYLDEFLSSLQPTYNIIIWSASSMAWLKSRREALKIAETNVNAMLDFTSMISVRSNSNALIDCKALALIWRMFETCSEKTTIMVDKIEYSSLNGKNKLVIPSLEKMSAEERKNLVQYLIAISYRADLNSINHDDWRTYIQMGDNLADHVGNMVEVSPNVLVTQGIPNERDRARCKIGSESCECILIRLGMKYYSLVDYFHNLDAANVLKIHQLAEIPKHDSFLAVMGEHETLSTWIENNPPDFSDRRNVDANFLKPIRSLIKSSLSVLDACGDFEMNADDVFVRKGRDGKNKLIVGFVKLKPRQGASLACLKSIATIVKDWFGHYGYTIPDDLDSLRLLLDTWGNIKLGGPERYALRLLPKHPAFYLLDLKSCFDFVIKFKTYYVGLDEATRISEICSAFHDLGQLTVKSGTVWYDEKNTNYIISRSMEIDRAFRRAHPKKDPRTICHLVPDIRNIGTHIFDNKERGKGKVTETTWRSCHDDVEKMMPYSFAAIHLMAIKCKSAKLFNRF